ncbi:MAG: TrkA family potassium uptake protein [Amaricoccus sp.]|uniref:potassium channel family protein n=1 Tax=Amaricoccus sp. TaxID=1872485 RepID=UPI0039E2F6E0
MAERKNSFAVIGLGAFGSTVAVELARLGAYVLGVDLDDRRVARVADQLAEAKILDATDETALREAGFDRYGAVLVAIGESLEASILATLNARLVGCRTVWVKARDKTHHRILSRLGVDRVILPEIEMGQHVAQMLHNPLVRDYASLGNGFFAMSLDVPAPLDGRRIASLDLARHGLRALALMRGTKALDLADDPVLAREDHLVLLGRDSDLRRFGDAL